MTTTPDNAKKKAVASITGDRLAMLNAGQDQSRTLTECLAVDFGELARACLPKARSQTIKVLAHGQSLGILRRMELSGVALLEDLGPGAIAKLAEHRSDTVRGWSAFMIGARTDLDLRARLDLIKPLADDRHFGVREWAWMAVRPDLARQLPEAIAQLSRWTIEPSAFLRRFASEATRPRGVWCAHIGDLRANPHLGLPILEPLRADPETYVQDSVANWLNDASKDQPDWVRSVCRRWQTESPGRFTERICKRAQRSLTAPSRIAKGKT